MSRYFSKSLQLSPQSNMKRIKAANNASHSIESDWRKPLLLTKQFQELVDTGNKTHVKFLEQRASKAIHQLDEFQSIVKGSKSSYRLFRFLNPNSSPSQLKVLKDVELLDKSSPLVGCPLTICDFLEGDNTQSLLASSISRKFMPILQTKAKLSQTVRTHEAQKGRFREFKLCTDNKDNVLKHFAVEHVEVSETFHHEKAFQEYLLAKQALLSSMSAVQETRRSSKSLAALRKRVGY